MRMKPAITLDDAKKLLAAAEQEAARNKWEVVIAILNDGGRIVAVHRMDGARPGNDQIAIAKATTSAMTCRPSVVWERWIEGPHKAYATFPFIGVQGGLPIIIDGDLIGAIGVSGVHSSADEQIAMTAIRAVFPQAKTARDADDTTHRVCERCTASGTRNQQRQHMDDRTAPANSAVTPSKRKPGTPVSAPPFQPQSAEVSAQPSAARGEPADWISIPADERGDALVAAMGLGGVDYMFFNSGSEIMFMQEAIAKANALGRPAPRLVMMTHEYPTLNAALGYAAVTGRMAATAVHVDVGTQHYGCAIHTARHSGLPVLITAGAPPVSYPGSMRGARDGSHFWVQQTPDQNGIVRQYMKWDHRLEYQDNPGLIVSRALQIAQSEPRGPVYLSLPREIAFLPAHGARFPTAQQLGIARPPAPDPDGISELAQRLIKACNPAIVVQRSGRNRATVPALVRLAEVLGAPVGDAAARSYQCFPMDHPLYQSITLDLSQCDVVLVIEADVPWMPGPQQPPSDAYIAVIDIDPIKAHIGTYEFGAHLRLMADTAISLDLLLSEVEKLAGAGDRKRFAERAARFADLTRARLRESERAAQEQAGKSPISPLWLSHQIAAAMDDNCLMLDETLMLSPLPRYLRFSEPGTYFRNPGSGGGWCAGAALGAKLGRPEKDVVAVSGDGFYMYSVANAAIAAAVRYRAPFMSVIYQNRSYSTGTRATAAFYPDGYSVRGGLEAGYFDPPIDFAKEAEAAGAYGENVKDPGQVGPALQRGLAAIRSGTPAVIAVWLPKIMRDD